jgi:adenosylcobinamide-phosphate synthase
MTMARMSSASFAAGYTLDLVAGDPQDMPHPVRLIGAAISMGERWLRHPHAIGLTFARALTRAWSRLSTTRLRPRPPTCVEKSLDAASRSAPATSSHVLRAADPASPASDILRGAVLTGTIAAGSWLAAWYATRAGGRAAEVLLGWTTLATRSLLEESAAVLNALEQQDIVPARRLLSMIVGRDTDTLHETEILRAVIETLAEGLCDGIVAPMFYLALGGVPLAFAYKAVNTLDSMIGHPEPPYRYFGRVAARLDDAANFIPARIAAFAVVAAALMTGRNSLPSWRMLIRDGALHPSPNAGRPEAAMAGALDVRLGGMNYYNGQPSPKPVLGREGRSAAPADARAALRIVTVASLAVFSVAWLCLRWRERHA